MRHFQRANFFTQISNENARKMLRKCWKIKKCASHSPWCFAFHSIFDGPQLTFTSRVFNAITTQRCRVATRAHTQMSFAFDMLVVRQWEEIAFNLSFGDDEYVKRGENQPFIFPVDSGWDNRNKNSAKREWNWCAWTKRYGLTLLCSPARWRRLTRSHFDSDGNRQ